MITNYEKLCKAIEFGKTFRANHGTSIDLNNGDHLLWLAKRLKTLAIRKQDATLLRDCIQRAMDASTWISDLEYVSVPGQSITIPAFSS